MPSFSEIFDNAVDAGYGPSEDLVDGNFTVTIVSTNWTPQTKGGHMMAGFLCKAVEGETAADGTDVSGHTVWANQVFMTSGESMAMNHSIFARIMKGFGITGAMLDTDPEKAVAKAVGQTWKVTVETKGDFTNVRFKSPVAGEVASASPPAPLATEPSETPAGTSVHDDVWNL